MMANSPAAVAAAFSSNSSPVCPGDRRWAAIPEPITTAVRNPLPSNSATSRRHSATVTVPSPGTAPARSGAAGAGLRAAGLLRGPAARRVRPGARRGRTGRPGGGVQRALGRLPALLAGLPPEGLAVLEDRVDLPSLAAWCRGHPELVLPGVAAGGVPLVHRREPGPGEPAMLSVDRRGVRDLDAEVVEAAALARVFQQDQLQRRLGDGEVGVPGPALGGLGTEQRGVERDRLVDVVDVQRELHTGHGN